MLTGSVQIVCDREVFRRGLSTVLSDAGFSVEGEYRNFASLLASNANTNSDLLLVVVDESGLTEDIEADLASAKAMLLGSRSVVLAFSQAKSHIIQMLHGDVDAIVSATVTPDVLSRTLELVLLGQKIAPMEFLQHAAQISRCGTPAAPHSMMLPPSGSGGTSFGRLSSRENQVLGQIKQGLSNREIACSLDISEATVKMHVKILMRKRNVKNRTQLAILGLAEDRTGTPAMDRRSAANGRPIGMRSTDSMAG